MCGAANGIRAALVWGAGLEGYFPIEACASFFGGAIFVTAILVNG